MRSDIDQTHWRRANAPEDTTGNCKRFNIKYMYGNFKTMKKLLPFADNHTACRKNQHFSIREHPVGIQEIIAVERNIFSGFFADFLFAFASKRRLYFYNTAVYLSFRKRKNGSARLYRARLCRQKRVFEGKRELFFIPYPAVHHNAGFKNNSPETQSF